MSVLILQDEILHYEVLGRGKPLIFLHGWVGSWRYWVPTMQAASISFRTYALDFWGYGDSTKNPQMYALEQQVTLLDQFLEEMGIGKIALAGHGLGAIVAALYAHRSPQRVDRIILTGLPSGSQAVNPRLLKGSMGEVAEWLLGKTPTSEAALADLPKADVKALHAALAMSQQLDLKHLINQIVAPCLLVYGQNDPLVASPVLEQILALPDHIHPIIFEQSGHFPMLDESSKFNRLIADFLALNSGESPQQLQLKEEWKRRIR